MEIIQRQLYLFRKLIYQQKSYLCVLSRIQKVRQNYILTTAGLYHSEYITLPLSLNLRLNLIFSFWVCLRILLRLIAGGNEIQIILKTVLTNAENLHIIKKNADASICNIRAKNAAVRVTAICDCRECRGGVTAYPIAVKCHC